MHRKEIRSGFTLNQLAQDELKKIFINHRGNLDFIFEQVYIVYALSYFSGSHEINETARKALSLLEQEYDDLSRDELHQLSSKAAVACSMALADGIKVMQELPRNEYLIAYSQAKRFTESREGIINYLRSL